MISQIKAAGVLGLIALIIYCTWYITSDHYQKIIAQHQVQLVAADRDARRAWSEEHSATDRRSHT